MKFPQRFLTLFLLCYWWKKTHAQDFNPFPRSQRSPAATSPILPRSLTPNTVQQAFETAKATIAQRTTTVLQRGRPMDPRTNAATFRHNLFQRSKPRSQQLETVQEKFEEATRILVEEQNLSPEQIRAGLAEMDLASIFEDDTIAECQRLFNFTCRRNKRFRTFDGTCNNFKHPSWGMASSCFERLVDPVYADGIFQLRRSVSGRDLPSPRRVSLEIHSHMERPTDYLTHMFMQWGQFIDHDISLSPLEQNQNIPLECCPVDEDSPRQCGAILLDRDDPFFSDFGIDCLNNARTVICSSCKLGARQQTNQLTAFIDGSMIYGTSTNESDGLRNQDGSGTLRSINNTNAGELLPQSSTPDNDGCSFQVQDRDCFEAGDPRVNQHPALTSFHMLFLRQHNRLAKLLRDINPDWNDERLFQEARRIVGAQLQFITYNEFLPLVIGPERMRFYDLCVQKEGIFTEYDPTVQPTLMNEFSTAAFRFGHSMINSFFPEIARQSDPGNRLRDIFLWPFGLYNGQFEKVVRGMFQCPAQKFDRSMVLDVTNHLYQLRNNQTGLDLASLNVFRGRDHGIPPYVDVVRFCGGPDITTFAQLDLLFQRGYRRRFQHIYESVEDIDLFSGGLAEKPNKGAIVGPTFTCIIGIQFYHLKYGDRFYFEHGEQAGSFTEEQLGELKKTSLAKIICDNSRIDVVQENVMIFPSSRNPQLHCEDFQELNLWQWIE